MQAQCCAPPLKVGGSVVFLSLKSTVSHPVDLPGWSTCTSSTCQSHPTAASWSYTGATAVEDVQIILVEPRVRDVGVKQPVLDGGIHGWHLPV